MSINASSVSKVVPFQFSSNHQVRTVLKGGEPWFVAGDICKALGLGNVTKAILRIPKKHKGLNSIQTLGGIQRTNLISESGMYRLVLRSDKPEAEPFIEWVTSEVLPAIRKTGSYNKEQELPLDFKNFYANFDKHGILTLKEIPPGKILIDPEELPQVIADPGSVFQMKKNLTKKIALAAVAATTLHPSEAWGMLFGKGKGVLAEESI